MQQIVVKTQDSEIYEFVDGVGFVCTHANYEIERACCSGYDNEGNPSCACHGQDGVLCPNINCTGITDADVERIFDYDRSEY